jgi:hypothetical protein
MSCIDVTTGHAAILITYLSGLRPKTWLTCTQRDEGRKGIDETPKHVQATQGKQMQANNADDESILRDALRYRFLRDGAEITEGLHVPCHVTFPELPAESSVRARVGAEFDAAVDSAVDFAIASLTKTADGEKT